MPEEAVRAGHRTLVLERGGTEVAMALGFGPRIVSFVRPEEQPTNLFAELPDAGLPHPSGSVYRLQGGHRLWAAPEVPMETYLPDDDRPEVQGSRWSITAVSLTGPLRKSITLALDQHGNATATHTITNDGDEPVLRAAWAITMLAAGGRAFLPLRPQKADPYQAERSIILWPYASMADGKVHIADDHIQLDGPRDEPTKVGTALGAGWLAYHHQGMLFVKYASHPAGPLPDLGATGQVFSADFACELETLGALEVVEPGGSLTHEEQWRAFPAPGRLSFAEAAHIAATEVLDAGVGETEETQPPAADERVAPR